jgi:citrate synthase
MAAKKKATKKTRKKISKGSGKESLTITDNRTGRVYELPINDNTVRGMTFRDIKVDKEDFGLLVYDPGLLNSVTCKSTISFIDGDRGILEYRGYPIAQLAEQSNFLETAYLIVKGELPNAKHLAAWEHNITMHTMVHENLYKFMDGFRYDAHPMGMLVSTVGALSTFYPDAKDIFDIESRRVQARRLLGKMPTLAAMSYRHSMGLPYVYPDNDLGYTANFLSMMFRMTETRYKPNPVFERALEVLFILHADHEQNCSAHAMRTVGSSDADPYTAVAAACGALYGPLHGGANEAVIHILKKIGSVKNIPAYIKRVKAGEMRLMGFGHRVYKSYDPRARIIKEMAYQVFEETGKNPLIDIAVALEKIALEDEFFIERKLYPNVDFYSGIIYQAMGFPLEMFPVLFAIGRTAGWLAQWSEMVQDEERRIVRPRQIYQGERERDYVDIKERPTPATLERLILARERL